MGRSRKDHFLKDMFPEETKGLLHRKLGVPEGKNIPVKKLDKAAHSKNLKLKKEAIAAETGRRIAQKNKR